MLYVPTFIYKFTRSILHVYTKDKAREWSGLGARADPPPLFKKKKMKIQ